MAVLGNIATSWVRSFSPEEVFRTAELLHELACSAPARARAQPDPSTLAETLPEKQRFGAGATPLSGATISAGAGVTAPRA